MIASGGTSGDTTWTDVLSTRLKGQTDAISFHYYTIPTGKWDVKGAATGFDEAAWIATLDNTLKIDAMIKANEAVLDKNDPDKKIALIADEWGTWYDVEKGTNAGFLFQQNTLRDAVVAALNFNIFNAHAERVQMTNIAQMVNVLQSMIITDQRRMFVTPTYYAYQMYVPFQGATALPAVITGNAGYTVGGITIPGVSVSAARTKDGKVYLALVNTNPEQATEVLVDLAGQRIDGASGQLLSAGAMDAHNTFDQPGAVNPVPFAAKAMAGK